jgi:hypothetical protein
MGLVGTTNSSEPRRLYIYEAGLQTLPLVTVAATGPAVLAKADNNGNLVAFGGADRPLQPGLLRQAGALVHASLAKHARPVPTGDFDA